MNKCVRNAKLTGVLCRHRRRRSHVVDITIGVQQFLLALNQFEFPRRHFRMVGRRWRRHFGVFDVVFRLVSRFVSPNDGFDALILTVCARCAAVPVAFRFCARFIHQFALNLFFSLNFNLCSVVFDSILPFRCLLWPLGSGFFSGIYFL